MKIKLLSIVTLCLLIAGCQNNKTSRGTDNEKSNGKKILIAYYSHSFGNTRALAEQVHHKFGGDLFEIEMVNNYPDNDQEVIAMVKAEMETNPGYRPELKNKVTGMKDYDVVFIGSPIWFGTAAPPVFTFMDSYDFSGKTIIPFYTCGGGDEGTFVKDLKEAVPNANFIPGFGNNKSERENGTHIEKVEQRLDQIVL